MEPKESLPKMIVKPMADPPPSAERRIAPPPPAGTVRRARPPKRRYAAQHRTFSWSRSLGVQCLACLVVALLAVGVQKLDFPAGNGLVEGLRFVVSRDAAAVEKGGAQMNAWMENAVAVFSGTGQTSVAAPASGRPETTPQGFVYTREGPVQMVMDGMVFYKGTRTDGTPYTCMRHGDGYESVYEGVRTTVSVGQELRAGDCIGSLYGGARLLFRLTQDGLLVDLTEN